MAAYINIPLGVAGIVAATPKASATFLADADATINAGLLGVSRFFLLPGTLTTNRTITFATANNTNNDSVEIICLDTSANTYTIKNAATTTIFTKNASQAATIFRIFRNAGDWIANERLFINGL